MKRLGEYLVEGGDCTPEQVAAALRRAAALAAEGVRLPLGAVLLEMGYVSQERLRLALERQRRDGAAEPEALSRRAAFLRRSPLFASLPGQELDRLAELAEERELARGEVLFHRGDPGDALYFVASGAVAVLVVNEEGAEAVLARLGPGECFGEMALLTGEPRSASVRGEAPSQLLKIDKNAFDALLAAHPQLSSSFAAVLARRLRQADILVEQERGRVLALRQFLAEEAERQPAQLLGASRETRHLRAQIEEAAQNEAPLLIVGEPGTPKRTLAQLVHEHSARTEQVFLSLDGAAVPRLVPSSRGEGQADEFVLEVSQESSLFGHARGCFSFAKTSRLGYLEAADAGTLVLENIERLAPSVQEKLLAFLREGRFRRLGEAAERRSTARLIATSSAPLDRAAAEGRFNPHLHALVAPQTIPVPPLRERKKDLEGLTAHLIQTYNALYGKSVAGLSPEARNMVFSYDWPRNEDELEEVVRRGVSLAQGRLLTPEEIFIGLAPFDSRGKANLLKLDWLRRLLDSPLYPALPQAMMVALFAAIVLGGLFGPTNPAQNLALVLVWGLWWPLLTLSLFLLARSWCGVCAIGAAAGFLQRRFCLRLPIPRLLRSYGLYGAGLLFLLIIWLERATDMPRSPLATAYLLLGILVAALAASFLFERQAWCRYLCPLGAYCGVYAMLAPLELRSNTTICQLECATHACYTGGKGRPCPMYAGAFALDSNQLCRFCFECLKNCPNRAVRLMLRAPALELWQMPKPALSTGFLAAVVVGSVLGKRAWELVLEHGWLSANSWPVLSALFVAASLAPLGLAGLASALLAAPTKTPAAQLFPRLALALLPLGFAAELGYQMGPLLREAGQLWPAAWGLVANASLVGAAWQASPATVGTLQGLALLGGAWGSWYVWRRAAEKHTPGPRSPALAPPYLVIGALLAAFWLALPAHTALPVLAAP